MIWDDLKYFITVYRDGSITAAAKTLKVEHSTVIRHLSRLEAALDVRLFNRLTRGWTLTEVGQEMALRSLDMEESALAIERFALGSSDLAGEVRFSAPPVLLSQHVVPALAGFRERHPDIELTMLSDMHEANLSRGEADIALRLTDLTQAELVTRTLCHVEYGLYGSPAWDGVPLEDRVYIGPVPGQRSFVAATMEQHVAGRKVAMRSNDLRVVMEAVRHGIGIGLLPHPRLRQPAGLGAAGNLRRQAGDAAGRAPFRARARRRGSCRCGTAEGARPAEQAPLSGACRARRRRRGGPIGASACWRRGNRRGGRVRCAAGIPRRHRCRCGSRRSGTWFRRSP
jgi:DNA-binding transcriptional LysR family regulator